MLIKASLQRMRSSPIKANYVAKMVRGMKASDALSALKNSNKMIAVDIRKLLQSAISNAENNHGMDIDGLRVKEAYVGKSLVLKRMHCRAKGRGNVIRKPYSNVYIILTGDES